MTAKLKERLTLTFIINKWNSIYHRKKYKIRTVIYNRAISLIQSIVIDCLNYKLTGILSINRALPK